MLETFAGQKGITKRFTRPGAVGAAFMRSTARVTGIMGPQGGGKTTIIINKILLKAAMQPASPVDGVARYRCIVWMRTYRELWAKVIPDWLEWIPKESKAFNVSWTGGVDNPAEHRFKFKAVENGEEKIVSVQVWFRAVGDQTPVEAAKGLHPTDAWLPESTSATVEMRKAIFGRLGRYPSAEHGGAPHRQLMCDWNAGDPYNWTTEYFINERPLGVDDEGRPMVEFFRQPGGRAANAENLHNLPPNYYRDQVEANKDDQDWIRRMVDNEIGFMRDGTPVFDQFSDQHNVSSVELTPWRGVQLRLAADAGLTPAVVIGQRDQLGETQILAEVTSRKTGPEALGEELMAVLDSPRFEGIPKPTVLWVDPTALDAKESSSRKENGEGLKSWATIVSEVTGLDVRPSRCKNDPVMRPAAVNSMFKRRMGTRAACVIDRAHCPELIKGCARDYKYEKTATVTGGALEYKDKPTKNFASHVCNALEYFAANVGEQDLLSGKEDRKAKRAAAARRRARSAQAQPRDPLSGYRGC